MTRQHSPLQQVREARQIAADFNLFLSEKKFGNRTDWLVFRKTGGGNVFVGKRSSPAGIRSFVAAVAGCR